MRPRSRIQTTGPDNGHQLRDYSKSSNRSQNRPLIYRGSLLSDAQLVITGEGSADRQTLMGKLPFGILQNAQRHQVPVALIAGRIKDRQQLLDAGFSKVECINPEGLPLEEAMKPTTARTNIARTVQSIL